MDSKLSPVAFSLIVELDAHRAQLLPWHQAPWYLKLAAMFNPNLRHFWVTVRRNIYYPDSVFSPIATQNAHIVRHELVHVRQWEKYGLLGFLLLYFLFPLPILCSGRWWLEREAYMEQIKEDPFLDTAWIANALWRDYLMAYPKGAMHKWLENARKEYLNGQGFKTKSA
jgi:hypothetical protein